MGHHGSPQAPLTLRSCPEALARLEERYILTNAVDEWSARDLLAWLKTVHPHLLQLSVYVVPPGANGEGAIYEVAQRAASFPMVRSTASGGAKAQCLQRKAAQHTGSRRQDGARLPLQKKGANGLMRETSLNQSIFEGEFTRGTTVYTVNGKKVGQVILSALREGYFVMEQGWLFTHELYLPATAIAKRDALWIGLNLSRGQLRQPRWRVPPDAWLVSGSIRPIIPPIQAEREDNSTKEEGIPLPPEEGGPP